MLNQHRPQESLNKFAYVHWSLCLNVRCWLLWCTHQTFGTHQFLLGVQAIEEWTHSWRSKLAQGSSDTCWNSSCFYEAFLSNKHPRPKHGIIAPNNDRTMNILDGKKTPCWPHKPSLLIDQSQVEKQITRHAPTACSQRVLSAHLIFEVCQTKDKHLPSILQFTRTKPTKVLPNTIPVQIRNQLRTRTNQNVEMLWKFREMKKILCVLATKAIWCNLNHCENLTWLSRYIDMTHKRHGLARLNFKALWYERGCDNRACPRIWLPRNTFVVCIQIMIKQYPTIHIYDYIRIKHTSSTPKQSPT